MTLEELRTYILDDPDELGLPAMAIAGNDNGIAEALNAQVIEAGRYVPRSTLEIFLIGQGIAATAEIIAADTNMPSPLRVACISLGKMLASREFPELNLDDPATIAMEAGLVAGTVMSQGQVDALRALSTMVYRSRAQELGWGAVSVNDVSACLDGHRTIVPEPNGDPDGNDGDPEPDGGDN